MHKRKLRPDEACFAAWKREAIFTAPAGKANYARSAPRGSKATAPFPGACRGAGRPDKSHPWCHEGGCDVTHGPDGSPELVANPADLAASLGDSVQRAAALAQISQPGRPGRGHVDGRPPRRAAPPRRPRRRSRVPGQAAWPPPPRPGGVGRASRRSRARAARSSTRRARCSRSRAARQSRMARESSCWRRADGSRGGGLVVLMRARVTNGVPQTSRGRGKMRGTARSPVLAVDVPFLHVPCPREVGWQQVVIEFGQAVGQSFLIDATIPPHPVGDLGRLQRVGIFGEQVG
jgi:hypothetical protein